MDREKVNEIIRSASNQDKVLDKNYLDIAIGKIIDHQYRTTDTNMGDTQLIIAIEELSELIKEISKAMRARSSKATDVDIVGLTEEMADVEICIRSLQLIFGIPKGDLNAVINAKLKKALTAIEEYNF